MASALMPQFHTLARHIGPAIWAMAVFGCGLLFAFPVCRLNVRSLLAVPLWVYGLAKRYLKPGLSPVFLFAFIFLFNTVAIFSYMISGGLVILPVVCALLTGLNVGVIMLKDAQEATPEEPGNDAGPRPARAWVGFLCLFTVVVELSAFWLAIGMGMKLGYLMRSDFSWATFAAAAAPRIQAYVILLVPALALSAAAEAAALSAMLRDDGEAVTSDR
jgi:hypothetical protein